ncbi:aminotransferase class V-fold PLP-dependent enzyme [Demequina oxidasica]|uniref:aminotransferase class V-fold PLP-dependent enzyme n=1 Tax=Demequina oxidasica TaxID=676199 RepID=UPI000782F3E7|nr:aminotransferase class V-fold PLP-dependent enzyme [Demequina oxidasica]
MLNTTIAASFPHIPGYLDSASYGLPAHATSAALARAAHDWSLAKTDPYALDASVDRMRAAYASIVGAQPTDVALGGSVSQMVGMVAASLPDGARVLAVERDFSSVVYPFLADPRLNVTLVPLERLVDEIRPGVDLVAVSSAQSCDGRVVDLTALAMAAHSAGVKTLIDVSQSSGWLPIHARDFDVVVAGAYKWLTCPRGMALAAIRPDATWIRPVCASWYGSDDPWGSLYGPDLKLSTLGRRLDTSPPWQLVEAGAIALETLAAQDIHAAYTYCTGLANDLRAELRMPASNSAILSVTGVEAQVLADAGVRASARDGRARMSFYIYNDAADVDLAARTLAKTALQHA